MLSEPDEDGVTGPYLSALYYLDADRDEVPQPAGMGGGILLPVRLKRPQIRREGKRRGYTATDLDDFVEIVKALDMHLVVEARKQLMRNFVDQAKASAGKNKQRR